MQTLNAGLGVVRRVLNLAASEWMDEQGMAWLAAAPKIKLFPLNDARAPYPLDDEEQALLFRELPDHLTRMALFKSEHGSARAGGVPAALGIRGEGARARHFGVHHPGRAREEWRAAPGRAESGREVGD